MTEYYTPKEMAAIFGMKVSVIYSLIKKGRISYIKHKGRIYIDSYTIQLFILMAKDMMQKILIYQQQKLYVKKLLEQIKNADNNTTESTETKKSKQD